MRFALILAIMLTTAACGHHTKSVESVRPVKPANAYRLTIAADSSMRQLVNPKWSCNQATATNNEALPYRQLSIFNRGESQTLQMAVHYLDQKVPTTDYLVVEGLECF